MLIVALVLAVIGLAALVTAVVTSNELVAWVCIAASVLGVILLIIDAIRERQSRDLVSVDADAEAEALAPAAHTVDETYENFDAEYPNDTGSVEFEDEPARDVGEPARDVDVVADTDVEPITESAESSVATESGALPEVHYETSDASDSDMEVRYVTSEEPDTGIEYVTDGDVDVDETKSR